MALWLIRRAIGLLVLCQRWYGPRLASWHIDDDVKLALKILRYAEGYPSAGPRRTLIEAAIREWAS